MWLAFYFKNHIILSELYKISHQKKLQPNRAFLALTMHCGASKGGLLVLAPELQQTHGSVNRYGEVNSIFI